MTYNIIGENNIVIVNFEESMTQVYLDMVQADYRFVVDRELMHEIFCEIAYKLNPNDPVPELTFRAIAPAGSVLIFNGQCWHGSGANNTKKDRQAIFGHFRINDWMLFQLDPNKNFPKEWINLLNPRQKELLRMSNEINTPISDDTFLDTMHT